MDTTEVSVAAVIFICPGDWLSIQKASAANKLKKKKVSCGWRQFVWAILKETADFPLEFMFL